MPAEVNRAVSAATLASNAAIRASAAFAFASAFPEYTNANSAWVCSGVDICTESDLAKVTLNSMQLSCDMGAAFNIHSWVTKWFVLD